MSGLELLSHAEKPGKEARTGLDTVSGGVLKLTPRHRPRPDLGRRWGKPTLDATEEHCVLKRTGWWHPGSQNRSGVRLARGQQRVM